MLKYFRSGQRTTGKMVAATAEAGAVGGGAPEYLEAPVNGSI